MHTFGLAEASTRRRTRERGRPRLRRLEVNPDLIAAAQAANCAQLARMIGVARLDKSVIGNHRDGVGIIADTPAGRWRLRRLAELLDFQGEPCRLA